MLSLKTILAKYIPLIVMFLVFIVVILLAIILLDKKNTKSKVFIYGLLMDLKTSQIFALSVILVNFMFLSYLLLLKIPLTITSVIISSILIISAYLILKKYQDLIINFIINSVGVGLIYFANLANTLKVIEGSKLYWLFIVSINMFGLLYYLFTLFKFIRDIKGKDFTYEK